MNKEARRRGAILVTVLWSVALLSALAMAASTTFRGFASILGVDRDTIEADALLTAGVEAAASLIINLGDVPLRDFETTVVMSHGLVHMALSDQAGRIDVGRAPVELLTGLFHSIGGSDRQANEVARRIVEWRANDGRSGDPLKRTDQGGNDDSPFTDARQLLQISDVPPEWVDAIAPLTTVYGNPTINPLTAPAEVIAALPGISQAALLTFLRARDNSPTDVTQAQAILAAAQQYLEVKPTKVVSVSLGVKLADGFASAAQCVIVVLPDDTEPYRILVWNPLPSGLNARP